MSKKLILYIIITFFCMLPISSYAWDNIGYYAQFSGLQSSSTPSYDSDNCETSGRFSYSRFDDINVSPIIMWYKGVSPTDYSGYAAKILDFTFRRDLDANKFYDVRIRFNGKDVRPYVTSDSVTIYTGTTQCRVPSSYQSDLSMISFINKATNDTNSDYIQVRLYASVPITNWRIHINQTKQSTSTNWGVKDIIFREVDMSGNNAIIENNTINSNNIINNQKENTQDIINNQNQNTQDIINSNKSCVYIDSEDISKSKSYLGNNGSVVTQNTSSTGVTDFINISSSDTLSNVNTSYSGNMYMCYYNANKSLISCVASSNYNNNTNINIPNNASYVRFTLYAPTEQPTFKLCKNGQQATNDALTDSSVPSGNDSFDEFNDMLPTNNTISSLIALPISLYTKVLNSINGTCSAITLGSLYNTNLVMPCINLESYLGSNLFNVIDLIMSGGFVLIIAKKMVKAFHSFTSMKDGDVINND